MARLTPKILNLSDGEREQLQQLLNRHNTPQQIALRAKIILMASVGQNHRQIARNLDINRQTVRLWRNRWWESEGKELPIVQRLQDSERVGARPKFSMEQVIELFALACSHPVDYGRPISHWTARELADEIIKQGMIQSISIRHVGRLLEEAELKPHALSLLVNPPLKTKNLTQKWKILLVYTSAQLSII
ncbi:helix-turn-helix domain-containing protein [Nostoc sp.]|uniref:helix-turn-helix domain-containing protein n=1 Tax=Nostoc sp. TaxID=1180 RepID=UPI002FF781B2